MLSIWTTLTFRRVKTHLPAVLEKRRRAFFTASIDLTRFEHPFRSYDSYREREICKRLVSEHVKVWFRVPRPAI